MRRARRKRKKIKNKGNEKELEVGLGCQVKWGHVWFDFSPHKIKLNDKNKLHGNERIRRARRKRKEMKRKRSWVRLSGQVSHVKLDCPPHKITLKYDYMQMEKEEEKGKEKMQMNKKSCVRLS